ncbi:hypothetical protein Tco_0784861 [Tanacetum coccineum]
MGSLTKVSGHRKVEQEIDDLIEKMVTYRFTLIVLSALRRSDNENGYDEVLKLKNFKKDALLKLSSYQIENSMSMLVQKLQDHKKEKDHKMMKRDYAWLMISRSSRSHSYQVQDTSQSLKSKITTTYHKLMIEVKDYKLKTKVKA